MVADGMLRIGELSRRSGVTPELLRAWERRYGLLHPTRSSGGLRLYSSEDLERVRLMRRHLAEGLAAAEAAALASRAVVTEPEAAPALDLDAARRDLAGALERFDERAAHDILDRLLAATTVDALLGEILLPYLRDLGDRWRRGAVSVAQEHFASGVLRGRLLGLARGWGVGVGPLAILACPPGERHELGLIAFGLALRARGWRVAYLGADTPLETLADAARTLDPDLVVVSAVSRERLGRAASGLRDLARDRHVAVGGAGVREDEATRLGAIPLTGDPVAEAERMTRLIGEAARPAAG